MLASLGLNRNDTGGSEAETYSLETEAGILQTQAKAGASERTSLASDQRAGGRQTEPSQPGTAIADATRQAAAGLRARIEAATGSDELPDSAASDSAENGKGSVRTGKPERTHAAQPPKDSKAQSAGVSTGTGLAMANLPLPIAAPVSGNASPRTVDAREKSALHREPGSMTAGSTGNQATEQPRTAASQTTAPGPNGIRAASSGIDPADGGPVNGEEERVSGEGKAGDAAGTAPPGNGSAADAMQTQGQRPALQQSMEQGSGGQAGPDAIDQNRDAGAFGATAAQSLVPTSDGEMTGAFAGKRVSAEPVSRAVRGGEATGSAGHGRQLEGSQTGGAAGDAATLARDPGGVRGTMSAAGGNTTGGSTAGGNGASASGSATFAALDAGTNVGTPGWVHAGPRGAEAGFQDPALGWVGVRADASGGAIHASLVPGSDDAAQALSGHLAGLSAHLAEQHTAVETLAVASPETGRAGWGAEQGSEHGTGQNSGQGSNPGTQQGLSQSMNQGGYAQPQSGVDSGMPAASASVRTGPVTHPAGTMGAVAERQSGATISVIA